jgi:geranylgeranyl diphosphate synthase type II
MQASISKLSDLIQDEIQSYDIIRDPENLYDPISYILELGGKRLRPLLTLLGTQLYTNDFKKALKPALGVEVFHNFTLIHDDIMDKSPIRRGLPTVHKKWNENIAILSGDVMLIKAYELISEVDDKDLRQVLNLFNACATGVCEGQQYDMDFEDSDDVTVDDYIEMIRLKTAVLLGFALELGGLIGGASKKDQEILSAFGENIGIGFQIKDDILDVFGDHQKVGKQIAGDIIANKKTFLLIKALEKADQETFDKLNDWLDAKEFDAAEKVKEVTAIYVQLGVKEDAESLMNEYFEAGLLSLNKLDADRLKIGSLKKFTKSLIEREN